jgi:murein DD-endopeptidase MepM/ murein hydrolase activator NlpD
VVIGYQLCVTAAIGATAVYSWLEGAPAQGRAANASPPTASDAIGATAPLAPEPAPVSLPLAIGAVASDEGESYDLGGYALRFPLAGGYQLTDSFGDPRGSKRDHAGVDIMSDKLTEVYAVADGRVRWIVGEQGGGGHVALALLHGDGWRSYYMHLNNDTPGTDDGRGRGIAHGIVLGSRVEAGQLLGWVGDSGNAEHTAPHLHFELRDPTGRPVDPYASLSAAAERRRDTQSRETDLLVALASP